MASPGYKGGVVGVIVGIIVFGQGNIVKPLCHVTLIFLIQCVKLIFAVTRYENR